MTIAERIEEARAIENDLPFQSTAQEVFELVEKALRLLGSNQQLNEDGLEVKADVLKFAIDVYGMMNRGEQAFPYLLSFRELMTLDNSIARPKTFAELILCCLPQLAEMEAISDEQLAGIIEEMEAGVDEKEDHYARDFTLLEVYEKRKYTDQAQRLRAELLQKAVPVQQRDHNCDSCRKNFQIVQQVQLGRISEAEQNLDALIDSENFKCARSPRDAARALLNHYLEQDDLSAARPHADLLAENIDFPWPGSIHYANPLLEYYVRTRHFTKAKFWYQRFAAEMRTTQLSLAQERFWKWAGEMEEIDAC